MGIGPANKITRLELWPARLSRFLKERRGMPFAWGSNDCILFAADAVKELTGLDPVADYRGAYDSEETAAALLRELGGLEAAITLGMGFAPHTNPLKARRGDVVMIELDGIASTSIVDDSGRGLAMVRANEGIVLPPPPVTLAKKIWSY